MAGEIQITDSILVTVRTVNGPSPTDTSYDTDLTMYTNTALSILKNIGIGVGKALIKSDAETWSDFLNVDVLVEDDDMKQMAITFVLLKTKLLFDPPASSIVVQVIENSIKEILWRLEKIGDGGEEDAIASTDGPDSIW